MGAVADGYHYSGMYVNGTNTVSDGNVMTINLGGATIKNCEATGIYAAGYGLVNVRSPAACPAYTPENIWSFFLLLISTLGKPSDNPKMTNSVKFFSVSAKSSPSAYLWHSVKHKAPLPAPSHCVRKKTAG